MEEASVAGRQKVEEALAGAKGLAAKPCLWVVLAQAALEGLGPEGPWVQEELGLKRVYSAEGVELELTVGQVCSVLPVARLGAEPEPSSASEALAVGWSPVRSEVEQQSASLAPQRGGVVVGLEQLCEDVRVHRHP